VRSKLAVQFHEAPASHSCRLHLRRQWLLDTPGQTKITMTVLSCECNEVKTKSFFTGIHSSVISNVTTKYFALFARNCSPENRCLLGCTSMQSVVSYQLPSEPQISRKCCPDKHVAVLPFCKFLTMVYRTRLKDEGKSQ
jgi:hypothetical protein